MAEVRPAPIPIDKKEAFRLCLFGRPKETLDAPHIVLTCNSSLSLLISFSAEAPERFNAPIGITNGSTTTSATPRP